MSNNRNSYISCFRQAIENREEMAMRPGISLGFFSTFRHSKKVSPEVKAIYKALKNISNDESAKNLIKATFTHLKFNNHSFLAYLFDELCIYHFAEVRLWNQYNPKPVIYYRGTLYRGENRGPFLTTNNDEGIFKTGFMPLLEIEYLEQAIGVNTDSYGVSTSKDFNKVKHYPYVYTIDYHGALGVDVCATQLARGGLLIDPLTKMNLGKLQEVNILGYVPPSAIKKCVETKIFLGERQQIVYENKSYDEGLAKQEYFFMRTRRRCAFKDKVLDNGSRAFQDTSRNIKNLLEEISDRIEEIKNEVPQDKKLLNYIKLEALLNKLKSKSELFPYEASKAQQNKVEKTLLLTNHLCEMTLKFLEGTPQNRINTRNEFAKGMQGKINEFSDIINEHKNLFGKLKRIVWEIALCLPLIILPLTLFYLKTCRGGMSKTDTAAITHKIAASCK